VACELGIRGMKLLQKRQFQGSVNKSILRETAAVIFLPSLRWGLSWNAASGFELIVLKKVQRNWKELNKVPLRTARKVRAEGTRFLGIRCCSSV